jgi:hypothetical protein
VYTGENLTCTGVEYGDSLTVVLQKLDEKYCEILSIIENCNTTTTTSSTTSSHTTLIPSRCTSPFANILDILEPFVIQPNKITLTPSNQGGSFGILIERVSGLNPNNLTFALQIDRYALGNCIGGSSSFSFSTTLDANDDFKFTGITSGNSNLSAKVASVTVNSVPITTSPQTITVNGTNYVIEGYNACKTL